MKSVVSYTENHKYHIEAYSEKWKDWYNREEKKLLNILGDGAIKIYHVGSTAIPGLSSKPQLDILVTTNKLSDIDMRNKIMEKDGYVVYGDALKKGGRMFSRWKNGEKIVNIHVYPVGSPIISEYLDIKKYLLNHYEVVKEYGALKMKLYKKFPNDYIKYREFKDKYIVKLLKKIGVECEE